MAFYVTAITPGLVTLVLLTACAWIVGKRHLVFGMAAVGCLMSAATPWLAMWYASNVLNDHTANIGAGLLGLGQPLLAPLGALLGGLIGFVLEAALRRRGG